MSRPDERHLIIGASQIYIIGSRCVDMILVAAALKHAANEKLGLLADVAVCAAVSPLSGDTICNQIHQQQSLAMRCNDVAMSRNARKTRRLQFGLCSHSQRPSYLMQLLFTHLSYHYYVFSRVLKLQETPSVI